MILATHNGPFHADDVFGAALLTTQYPEAKLIRTRDEDQLAEADIVFDVGGVYDPQQRRFDHHQQTAKVRGNGIKFSAFGLLWGHYGLQYCDGDQALHSEIDKQLVQYVDAVDNGVDIYQLTVDDLEVFDVCDALEQLNPPSGGDEDFDEQFMKAVELATLILDRVKLRTSDRLQQADYFRRQYQQSDSKSYVVLERYVPVKQLAVEFPELKYVVFPDTVNDQWRLLAVAKEPGSFELRQPLPDSWAGLRDAELAEVTGVDDATFCHSTGFIAGAVSRQGALSLLQLALAS